MSATKQQERLVNRSELSQITGLSERAIQNAKVNHSLPFHKIGRHVYFYPSEVFKWIEDRKVVNG